MSIQAGLLSTVIVQLGNIFYGLVLPRMLILSYGSEVNGLMAGALQIVSLVALLEAGLSVASIRQLYAPLAQRDHSMVARLLGSVRHYFLRVAGWAAVVGLGAGILYALSVNSTLEFAVVLLLSWLVIAGPIVDFALNSKYYVFFVASQRVSKFQLAQLASIAYKILVVFGCARLDTPVLIMLFFLSLGPLLKWIILFALFRFEPFRIESSRPLLLVEQRGSVFGHQLLGSVIYSGPLLYIGAFIGATSASIFYVNHLVFGISYTFLSMVMGQVVVARLGHLYAGRQLLEVASLTNKMTMIVVTGAFVVMASSVVLLPSFLGLYLEELGDNYHSEVQTSLFGLWGFFNMSKLAQQTVVNAVGRFRDTLWISWVEVLVFLGVLIVGFQHASILLLLGALLSSCLVKSVLLWIFVDRQILRQTSEVILAAGLSAIALLAVCLGVAPSVAADSVFDWVFAAVGVVFLWVMVGAGLVFVSWGMGKLIRLFRRKLGGSVS